MPSGATRNLASIVNRTNNCGGNKKAGLGPTVGMPAPFAFRAVRHRGVTVKVSKAVANPGECPIDYKNNPGGQCSGGAGRMQSVGCQPCGKCCFSTADVLADCELFIYKGNVYRLTPNIAALGLRGPLPTCEFGKPYDSVDVIKAGAAHGVGFNDKFFDELMNPAYEGSYCGDIEPLPAFPSDVQACIDSAQVSAGGDTSKGAVIQLYLKSLNPSDPTQFVCPPSLS